MLFIRHNHARQDFRQHPSVLLVVDDRRTHFSPAPSSVFLPAIGTIVPLLPEILLVNNKEASNARNLELETTQRARALAGPHPSHRIGPTPTRHPHLHRYTPSGPPQRIRI